MRGVRGEPEGWWKCVALGERAYRDTPILGVLATPGLGSHAMQSNPKRSVALFSFSTGFQDRKSVKTVNGELEVI
jgi:hypothetical protein